MQSNQQAKSKLRGGLISTTLIFGLGLIAIGMSVFWLAIRNQADRELNYDPNDVVYEQSLHIIHEMASSGTETIPLLPKDSPRPMIEVSHYFYDFGIVGADQVVTHQFAVYNRGNATLSIKRAFTTCGCTTADLTATIIPPGKLALLTLSFDAGYHANISGQTVRRGLIIETNDPLHPQVEIWTQAYIRTFP